MQLETIACDLKRLAKELDCVVLLHCQLNADADSGAQRSRQQPQRRTVQNPAIGCDSLGGMVTLATSAKPNENQGETLVSPEKMQVRVLGLEPRTHGLKVRCSTD